ncbi:hypothetical protein HNO52_05560 [Billgrantia diversa]|uniref:hypothetical protein n=1 Tax=Halomonas sp. MCCC 1A13316 TaxID=2733487 RepID=UPI0018A3EA17|nr:hypothetical protein [Halomonas sp. MCCC 1A13316]QOR38033.1 hypothetical protein HNO52_05560 [Halomonas sp. MCCC 1A13316]
MRKGKEVRSQETRSKGIWLVWIVVALCYAVPYTLLGDVPRWYGSFLFWALAGLVVIVLNVFLTRDFKDR